MRKRKGTLGKIPKRRRTAQTTSDNPSVSENEIDSISEEVDAVQTESTHTGHIREISGPRNLAENASTSDVCVDDSLNQRRVLLPDIIDDNTNAVDEAGEIERPHTSPFRKPAGIRNKKIRWRVEKGTRHVPKIKNEVNPPRDQENLGDSTDLLVPGCMGGSDSDQPRIVVLSVVSDGSASVADPADRVGGSRWLNDPNINVGAGTSRMIDHPDVQGGTFAEDNAVVRATVLSDNDSVHGEINTPPVLREMEDEALEEVEDMENIQFLHFTYPPAWCGVDEISADIPTHMCGYFDNVCLSCRALFFGPERNTRGDYNHCCNSGKLRLPPLGPYPDLLRNLFMGEHPESGHFLHFIRKYNCALSFTSVQVTTEQPPGRGPYVYRIHGQMYHCISSSVRPRGDIRPKYSQLYVYDAEEALRERMNMDTDNDLKEDLLRDLDRLIREINPFARSYKLMKDVEQEVLRSDGPDAVKNIRMWFTTTRPSGRIHRGRQNNPVSTDVAMIFRSDTGAPPTNMAFCVFPEGAGIREVCREHPSCDPLTYPVYFPNGEPGFSGEYGCSPLRFYCYRLSVRESDDNIIFRGKRLFQQYIVDVYCAVEANRLRYYEMHQRKLRVETYRGLLDHIANIGNRADVRVGVPKILPSSFIGGARYMQQRYQDAMAIVREFGKPDLFITFTCNPKWLEIKDNLFPGQTASDRPDIVSRVFDMKVNAIIEDIWKKKIFGEVTAFIYVIEFQKRGLPHMHLLLILNERYKIRNADDIDKIVSAEFPNKNRNPKLFDIVASNMIHGPCGVLNKDCVCMVNGKCSKQYPKRFCDETRSDVNGYPEYRRPDNGRHTVIGRNIVDNRFVVPYNPYLLMKYDAHINVEVCSTLKSVKYLYKYVYKGHDCANVTFMDNGTGTMMWDEIRAFQNSRYVSAPEGMWRMREKPLNKMSHAIIRLAVHLPNMQCVYFRENEVLEAANAASTKDTHLTAFFKLNEFDADAREYLYMDIPKYYVWDSKNCAWKKRQRGGDNVISRMYSVSVHDIERYYLRILLCHVYGPKSFLDLRTYNGVVYDSFKEACIARNLLQDDREWERTLTEACTFEMPKKLRQLFAFICAFCLPRSPLGLWEKFKSQLSEDFIRITNNEDVAFDRALADIARVLAVHNQSLESMGLPSVNPSLIDSSDVFDPIQEDREYQDSYSKLNAEQKLFFDDVMSELNCITSNGKCFHLDAFAGAGKSFVLNCILNKVRANGDVAIAVAWSGIAAMLLKGGTTVHSRFKLPIPLDETAVCRIRPNSREGLYIKSSKIIIWDECTMTHKFGLEAVDRCLRDITGINEPFGGKVIIMSGDWRQILPVVPHGNRLSTVESCVKQSHLWVHFRRYTLVRNMRTNPSEIQFSNWLLDLGNGNLSNTFGLGDDVIEIPQCHIVSHDLLTDVYGDDINIIPEADLLSTAILCSKNDTVLNVNEDILSKLSGDIHTYYSADSFEVDEEVEEDLYPMEYVNSITPSGMPPHKLHLKVGAVVMLLRNLNISGGLCNGTRLIIRRLMRNVIDAEIAIGANKGDRVFIPRINLRPSESNLPFKLMRRQFPLRLSFAMTINKAQGQSLKKVGLLLREPVFTHGMLYVAFSRASNRNGVRVAVTNSTKQGKLLVGRNNVFTTNVVYTEILS